MRFDTTSQRVFVRQSWLNDLLLCPQRARLGIKMPQMRTGSDATIMGTALHHAIETSLALGGELPLDELVTTAVDKFHYLQVTETWKETNIDPDKYEVYIQSMCEAWHNDIRPMVEMGGMIEKSFAFPLGITVNDWGVWCEGTMDYITPSGQIWDWKTASRAYNARDKQAKALQPTVYAAAAVANGFSPEFPVDFSYGIMLRNEKPKAQIVDVRREETHYEWLKHIVKPAVQYATNVGFNEDWVMNDDNNLCSERWCSFWSVCKGAFHTSADLMAVDKANTPPVE
jgi:hypothetical protein